MELAELSLAAPCLIFLYVVSSHLSLTSPNHLHNVAYQLILSKMVVADTSFGKQKVQISNLLWS